MKMQIPIRNDAGYCRKTARWVVIALASLCCAWVAQMLAFPRVNGLLLWERLRAVEGTSDQSVLARVAADAKYPSIRLAAVRRLTDPAAVAAVAFNDSDVGIRLSAVEGLTDQAVLAQVARDARDFDVRLTAVERLTDQAALAQVASQDINASVRRAAFEMLTDQVALAQVAINASSEDDRLRALARLTDQAALAQIATNDDSAVVGLAAVERLGDQAALAHVAGSSSNVTVQLHAVERLIDQPMLLGLVTNASDLDVRRAAIERLTEGGLSLAAEQMSDPADRAFLVTLAKFVFAADAIPAEHRGRILDDLMPVVRVCSRPGWLELFGSLDTVTIQWTRKSQSYIGFGLFQMSGEKIDVKLNFESSQRPLSRTWTSDFPAQAVRGRNWRSASIRPTELFLPWLATDAAVDSLTDQILLAEVAVGAYGADVRLAAFRKITDLAALAQAAGNESASPIDLAAIESVTDQKRLALIALGDSAWWIRLTAVMRLTDQAPLVGVATSDQDPVVRLGAVANLTDQAVLVQVAHSDKSWSVRHGAVEALRDQTALAQLAINTSESSISRAAVERLTDRTVLVDLATSASSQIVRRDALKRLTNIQLVRLVAEEMDDPDQREFVLTLDKFATAANSIPVEHRGRILDELMPAVRVYSLPEWRSRFGSLASINFQWTGARRQYTGNAIVSWGAAHPIDGEQIVFTAVFREAPRPLTATWRTTFPRQAPLQQRWESAQIQPSDVFLPWIATHRAVESLTDQTLLAKVAANAGDADVRRAAVEKLIDSSVLASIAAEDVNEKVRAAAARRVAELEK